MPLGARDLETRHDGQRMQDFGGAPVVEAGRQAGAHAAPTAHSAEQAGHSAARTTTTILPPCPPRPRSPLPPPLPPTKGTLKFSSLYFI